LFQQNKKQKERFLETIPFKGYLQEDNISLLISAAYINAPLQSVNIRDEYYLNDISLRFKIPAG